MPTETFEKECDFDVDVNQSYSFFIESLQITDVYCLDRLFAQLFRSYNQLNIEIEIILINKCYAIICLLFL